MKKPFKITVTRFIFASLLCTSCLAISSESYLQDPRKPPENAPRIKPSYLNIGFNLSYNIQGWKNFNDSFPSSTTWNNGNGHFNYGFDVNYLYGNNFFFEAGWYVSKDEVLYTNAQASGTFFSYFGYLMIGKNVALSKHFLLFGKSGVAFNFDTKSNTTDSQTQTSRYWNWIYSAGITYEFNANLSINLQYMLNPGYDGKKTSRMQFHTPVQQLIGLTLNYKFKTNNIAI